MKLARHRIKDAKFVKAVHIGGNITPELVILHDTAARPDASSVNYLASRNRPKVSVHFVIARDGTLTQLVPTNRRANHAGRSSYHGRSGCNAFSIGIEIENPGIMRDLGNDYAEHWQGDAFENDAYGIEVLVTPQHGRGAWMAYTADQLETVTNLCEALFEGIPTLKDIQPHWYVSPGRKVDTNPLFPLEQLRSRVLGVDDPNDVAAEDGSELVLTDQVSIHAPDDSLNMRRWPSFNPNVIGSIPDGTIVPVERSGTFEDRLWHLVRYGGQEGWIVASYTRKAI